MRELIPKIYAALYNGQPVVLAAIVSHRGSTPRSAGASMVIHQDGAIVGTIGGGRVEGVVIEDALSLYKSKQAIFARYDLTRAGDMDLVCGGEMQVVIEYLAPTPENSAMFCRMQEGLSEGHACLWLGKMTAGGKGWTIERAVCTAKSTWQGSLNVESPLANRLSEFVDPHEASTLVEYAGDRYLLTRITPFETVCLMGGGHVSQEIARLSRQVDFRTLVFDDRAEFANTEKFPNVDQVFICDDFATLCDVFEIPAGSYIVIVTRGHRHDKEVLAQALRCNAAYIGMIGSRTKRENVYRELLAEGFTKTELQQVHCPIGLSIDAETPAEIAVSVVAELIQHRAKRKQHD